MEVIDEAKLRECSDCGHLLLRGVVPRDLIDDASRSIDDLIAQPPPPMGAQGPYFPRVTNVETFLPLLLRSSAFALAESLVGAGRLTIPRQAQVALNIPPHPHRPGGRHLDGVSVTEPDGRPGTFTLLAGVLITDQPRQNAQLGKALEGDAWHGPSVLETLEGVTVEQAAAHPTAGAHSIWELVLHLCGTYDLVLRRLGGELKNG